MVVEKFIGGQKRIEQPGTLVLINGPPFERMGGKGRAAPRAGRIGFGQHRCQCAVNGGGNAGGRPGDIVAAMRDERGKRRRQRIDPGRQLHRCGPRGERQPALFLALVQFGLAQPRHEIALVDGNGRLERHTLACTVICQPTG